MCFDYPAKARGDAYFVFLKSYIIWESHSKNRI